MDCLTLRRIKLSTPEEVRPKIDEHLRGCPDCAAFVSDLEMLEGQLHEVMNVPVPEGFAEQIILRHREARFTQAAAGATRWLPRLMLALAASLVLAISTLVGYNAVQSSRHIEALGSSLIAHVVSEPQVLQARENVEPVRFERALASYGGRLSAPMGEVRHLGQCPIDGVLAHHIMIQTPEGPVTLILVPERRASLRTPMTRDGYALVILPLPGGSLGIVADSTQRVAEAERLVRSRVRWKT